MEGSITPVETGKGEDTIRDLQGSEVPVTSCTAWAGLGGPQSPPAAPTPPFVSERKSQG